MRSQGDYATAIVKEKTLWRILEEVTLFWCVACAISATEKVKSHQHRSTSVTGNDCALVKSPLALEMIRLKSAIWEEGSPRLKRLFACWYSGALPLDLFFSAAALETDLYAGVSLVLPVYCKLPCHGRARARVSGLEGGGKGSSSGAVGEGRHSHFLRREKKKTSAHSLWPVISTFTAAFLFIWSVCEDLWLCLCSGRSSFGGRCGGFLSLHSIRTSCFFDFSVEIWIFRHTVGLTFLKREARWMGVSDVALMWNNNIHAAPFGLTLKSQMEACS